MLIRFPSENITKTQVLLFFILILKNYPGPVKWFPGVAFDPLIEFKDLPFHVSFINRPDFKTGLPNAQNCYHSLMHCFD